MALPEDERIQAIRQILLHNWDPLRLGNKAIANTVYEAHVFPIFQMLAGKCSKEELIRYLQTAKASLGVLNFPRHRESLAAGKLLKIDCSREGDNS